MSYSSRQLVAELAGGQRFGSEGKLARAAGVAPIPATGKPNRHRPDRGGDRQVNAADPWNAQREPCLSTR